MQKRKKSRKQFDMTAVIYDKRGMVLAIGKNSYVKTHPLMMHYGEKVGETNKPYIHAELAAILKCKDLSKAHTIKIFRFLEDGSPANAKPCPICCSAIKATPIKHIEHT